MKQHTVDTVAAHYERHLLHARFYVFRVQYGMWLTQLFND